MNCKAPKPHKDEQNPRPLEADTFPLQPQAVRLKIRIPPPPIPGRTFWSLVPLE